MVQGPFGNFEVNGPFSEEEGEDPLILIVEFSDHLTKREVKESGQIISGRIQNMGKVVTEVDVDVGISNFLVVELGATNINVQVLDDIRDVARGREGYKNMTVSTVLPDEISRISRRA